MAIELGITAFICYVCNEKNATVPSRFPIFPYITLRPARLPGARKFYVPYEQITWFRYLCAELRALIIPVEFISTVARCFLGKFRSYVIESTL